MTMVIECESCQSRFRLDRQLFRGARALRVRCRKCGGPILAMNPDFREAWLDAEAPRAGADSPASAGVIPEPPSSVAVVTASPAEPGSAPEPGETAVQPPAAPADAKRAQEIAPPSAVAPPQDLSFIEEPPAEFPPALPKEPEAGLPGGALPPTSEQQGERPLPAGESEPAGLPDEEPPSPPAFDGLLPVPPDDPEPQMSAPTGPGGPDAVIDRMLASAPGEELSAGGEGAAGGTGTALRGAPRRLSGERPPYTRPLFVAGAGLWLLLLAGGALLFGTAGDGWKVVRELLPSSGTAPSTATADRPLYEIRDVRWGSLQKTYAGDLFVVRGTVVNAGPGESNGIRIQATLLGTDNAALGERDVFAGNTVDDAALRHSPPAVLKAALNNRFGDGERNRAIPPGGSLPFMVVFFDPPPNIGSILVKGVDAP